MERQLELYTIRKFKEIGAVIYKLTQVKGIPDRLVIYKGTSIFLEIKNPNKKGRVSAVQRYRINELIKNGARVLVVEDMQQVKDIIKELVENNKE